MSVEVKIPQIGESVATVFIASWRKQPGESVAAGETVLEVDSDKASMEVPAPVAGVLMEHLAAEGEEVAIGVVVARVDENATAASPVVAAPEPESEPRQNAGSKTGPAARQAASEAGVDLAAVEGTGRGGRILSRDVRAAAKPTEAAPVAPVAAGDSAPGLIERVPMSPLRRTIARRLVEAQQNAAILTTFNEVDLSEFMALRKRYQDRFVERYGIKLGFMSMFVKASVEALKEFPAVNAEIQGNDVLYKRYYNIGVAVSTERGLVVPVVRDADRMSFSQVEQAIVELATRARKGKLTMADFQDGTFTISNGGVFGSMMSTPILNPPQVGILGMHNIVQRPVARNGEVVIRPMMYLALSYDHRIIDGRGAVSFLVRVKELIENPERILFEV